MPGTLPVLNRRAVELALRTALTMDCIINPCSLFERKNYFYPDLPKGYQITQYSKPLAVSGRVTLSRTGCDQKRVGIRRIQLEEDAGRSIHDEIYVPENMSMIDMNRSGVPLVEIVTLPELESPDQAAECLRIIRNTLRWIEVCDGNMNEGSLRCDANVSIRLEGESGLGRKTEIKNLNSIRVLTMALQSEIQRQKDLMQTGREIEKCTLLWDMGQEKNIPMRSKEEEQDYRYFPEPDLLPLKIEKDLIDQVKSELGEMPEQRIVKWQSRWALSNHQKEVALWKSGHRKVFRYLVGQVMKKSRGKANPQLVNDILTQRLKDKSNI
jgi:aspartyl-tRNA(Asn)/glutamyl-tRNA(Gln) amidotransferase subunit B